MTCLRGKQMSIFLCSGKAIIYNRPLQQLYLYWSSTMLHWLACQTCLADLPVPLPFYSIVISKVCDII